MRQVALDVELRTGTGSAAARALRRAGTLPGVVYGFGEEATPIQVDSRQFQSILKGHSEHALINLRLGDRAETVVLKELQRDRVRHSLIHVDFQRVRMDTEITMDVEITLEGSAPGVAEGGILEFLARTLHVRALPTDVPETLAVDISGLRIGDSIHVRELVVPEGVTILTDEETVLVAIAAPRLEEEPTVEPAEPAEPERIGRKAEEDE